MHVVNFHDQQTQQVQTYGDAVTRDDIALSAEQLTVDVLRPGCARIEECGCFYGWHPWRVKYAEESEYGQAHFEVRQGKAASKQLVEHRA